MDPIIGDLVRDVELWVRLQPETWRSEAYRSASLLPNLLDDEYKRILGSSTFSITEAESLFSAAIEKRKARLRQTMNVLERPIRTGGRFLQHNFQETTYSCTPQEATEKFFDSLDIPPWDFWVALKSTSDQHFLYSWIPSEFVELVDRGVQCSAEENILWVAEDAVM